MSRFLYVNHRGSPTLTLLNVLGLLGVLNVLNLLNVLHVLNMLMDASLAYWALGTPSLITFLRHIVATEAKSRSAKSSVSLNLIGR